MIYREREREREPVGLGCAAHLWRLVVMRKLVANSVNKTYMWTSTISPRRGSPQLLHTSIHTYTQKKKYIYR